MSSWLKALEGPAIDTLKEGQMSGALSTRLGQLYDLINEDGHQNNAPISIDPGDMSFLGEDGGMALNLPIAYDIWYLWHTVNVLPDEATFETTLLEIGPVFGDRPLPAPLRTVLRESLSHRELPTLEFFRNRGIYYIKEMRFETFLMDKSPYYTSKGPEWINHPEIDHENRGIADVYAGYLAFPVGPLGVMRVQSLVSESLLDGTQKADNSEDPLPGNQLLPPMVEQSNDCMGRHLVESTYNIAERDTEYPADHMTGTEKILPHHWMRHWLRKDGQFPVPGEFVGLLCKAQSVPPHCWWYQETNPFLYSGNFFETEYYTSGIVLAIIEEKDKEDEDDKEKRTFRVTAVSELEQRTGHGEHQVQVDDEFAWEEIGTVYKVRVKNQDLYLRASDFAEYEIDARVAIRKVPGRKDENFMWGDLEPGRLVPGETFHEKLEYDGKMSGKAFEINTDWVIVPITFYKEV